MNYFIASLVLLAYLLAFWYLYILVMGLYRAYLAGSLHGVLLWLSGPALVIGYVVDLFSNYTIAAVVFREFPQSPTELVTDRLSRYIKADYGWRTDLASKICRNLLDPFDVSGKHCK